MKTPTKTLSAIGAAVMLCCGAASAATVDFGGYFRSGAGTSSEEGGLVCFRLPGATIGFFRLGNECDTYADLVFKSTLGTVDGTTFKATFRHSYGTQGISNWEQTVPSWREVFVEAQDFGAAMNMPALKGSTLWAGKRFYKNDDIHMLDYGYWEPNQGVGAGLENIDVGFGKFSYAIIRIGDQDWNNAETLGGFRPDHAYAGARSTTVHDLRIEGIAVNPGGKLNVGLDIAMANLRPGSVEDPDADPVVPIKKGNNGASFTLVHEQSNLFGLGGSNKIGLQIAQDAVSLKGVGSAASLDDRKEWLLFDHWYYAPAGSALQATTTFGMRKEDVNGAKGTEYWIGTRPIYNLNNIWSVFSEIGLQQFKPDGGDARRLTKVTVGTAFAMGPGIWARPSIRFFATFASWNKAASDAGPVVRTGRDFERFPAGFEGKTSAQSYGFQVEGWF